ncbi:hypothetical protein [Lacunimicrobium album]
MKKFDRVEKPGRFDKECRIPGQHWLEENPGFTTAKNLWSQFEPDLRAGFKELCAYCCMWIAYGEVDHFIPVSKLKKENRSSEIYDWDNFRYSSHELNNKKKAKVVIDPFVVENDWFEIILPSLQMKLTDKVPEQFKAVAEFVLSKDGLDLSNGEYVIRSREQFFKIYIEGVSIEKLRQWAPLIADAIERDLAQDIDWRVRYLANPGDTQ